MKNILVILLLTLTIHCFGQETQIKQKDTTIHHFLGSDSTIEFRNCCRSCQVVYVIDGIPVYSASWKKLKDSLDKSEERRLWLLVNEGIPPYLELSYDEDERTIDFIEPKQAFAYSASSPYPHVIYPSLK